MVLKYKTNYSKYYCDVFINLGYNMLYLWHTRCLAYLTSFRFTPKDVQLYLKLFAYFVNYSQNQNGFVI